jgi:membrane protease YdiL (CAAX protease family)
MPAVLVMMYTPGISAVISAWIFKERVVTFGWKPVNIRYLGYAFLFPFIVSVIGYGIIWASPYGSFTTEQVVNYKWARMLGFDLPAPFLAGFISKLVLASLAASIFVVGEELGWSGFLTPKLRKLFSVPVTSILVGMFWAAWHFPAIIGGFYGTGTPLYIALPGFTLVLIGASFGRTILVEKAKTLWPGVVLHVSHNVILMGIFMEMTESTELIEVKYLVSETGIFLGLLYILMGFLFWRSSQRSTM